MGSWNSKQDRAGPAAIQSPPRLGELRQGGKSRAPGSLTRPGFAPLCVLRRFAPLATVTPVELTLGTPAPSHRCPPLTSQGGRMRGLGSEHRPLSPGGNVACAPPPCCQHYPQPRWTFLDQGLGSHQSISADQPPSLSPRTSPSPSSPQSKLLLWVLIYILLSTRVFQCHQGLQQPLGPLVPLSSVS